MIQVLTSRWCLSALCLLLAGLILGQTPQTPNDMETLDVVRLRSGNVFRGRIIRNEPDSFLTLRSLNGVDFNLPWDQVLQVKQKVRYNRNPLPTAQARQGPWIGNMSMALLSGNGYYNGPAYDLQVSAGYRKNQWMQGSLGVGFENFSLAHKAFVLPVFLQWRSDLSRRRVSPFVSLQSGYGFFIPGAMSWTEIRGRGGLHVQPEVGLSFPFTSRTDLSVSFGVKYQRLTYWLVPETDPGPLDNKAEWRYHIWRYAFRIGLNF